MTIANLPGSNYTVFVQRFLLMLVFFLLFALPSMSSWFYNPMEAWYRPYLLWLIFIGITVLVHYSKDNHVI